MKLTLDNDFDQNFPILSYLLLGAIIIVLGAIWVRIEGKINPNK